MTSSIGDTSSGVSNSSPFIPADDYTIKSLEEQLLKEDGITLESSSSIISTTTNKSSSSTSSSSSYFWDNNTNNDNDDYEDEYDNNNNSSNINHGKASNSYKKKEETKKNKNKNNINIRATKNHPMDGILEVMLGFKPKLNNMMKLWEPGFRSFHILFKNSCNMPNSMMSSFIGDIFLAMYTSSWENQCEYCTAHCVGASLRRGVEAGRFRATLTERDESLFTMSASLSKQPLTLCSDHIIDMMKHFSMHKIEWIALAIGMMGFLNLVSSSFGLKLEIESLQESIAILGPKGWKPGKHAPENYYDYHDYGSTTRKKQGKGSTMKSKGSVTAISVEQKEAPKDNMMTYIRFFRHAPNVMLYENKWTKDIPSSWPAVGVYLEDLVGYQFPILSKISHSAAVVAYGTVLRENWNSNTSVIGLTTKALVGLVYAYYVNDPILIKEGCELANLFSWTDRFHISEVTFQAIRDMVTTKPCPKTKEECDNLLQWLSSSVAGFIIPKAIGRDNNSSSSNSQQQQCRKMCAILVLARSACTRPTVVPEVVINHVASILTPEERVETLIWVGLQQCFHRVHKFYDIYEQAKVTISKLNNIKVGGGLRRRSRWDDKLAKATAGLHLESKTTKTTIDTTTGTGTAGALSSSNSIAKQQKKKEDDEDGVAALPRWDVVSSKIVNNTDIVVVPNYEDQLSLTSLSSSTNPTSRWDSSSCGVGEKIKTRKIHSNLCRWNSTGTTTTTANTTTLMQARAQQQQQQQPPAKSPSIDMSNNKRSKDSSSCSWSTMSSGSNSNSSDIMHQDSASKLRYLKNESQSSVEPPQLPPLQSRWSTNTTATTTTTVNKIATYGNGELRLQHQQNYSPHDPKNDRQRRREGGGQKRKNNISRWGEESGKCYDCINRNNNVKTRTRTTTATAATAATAATTANSRLPVRRNE